MAYRVGFFFGNLISSRRIAERFLKIFFPVCLDVWLCGNQLNQIPRWSYAILWDPLVQNG
jgi:hypothetical protein